jgi:hypothetical protein
MIVHACGAAVRAQEPGGAGDWLLEPRPGVLELHLAHREGGRRDIGVLVVDPGRQALTWEGRPGEGGCAQKLEAPFASVRAVRDTPEGMLRLEILGQPRKKWVFVPLPHAGWLERSSTPVVPRVPVDFGREMRETFSGFDDTGRTGFGFGSFDAPQRRMAPVEVTADVRLAAERVRQALGRRPPPSVALYEALHGRPVDLSVAELLDEPAPLLGRAVRVRGVADPLPRGSGLRLRDEDAELRAVPQPELEALVQSAARDWRGREVEVTGVLSRTAGADAAAVEVVFWEYLAPEAVQAAAVSAPTVSIRELIERCAELTGRTVRVVGRFRGRNLEQDLKQPGPRSAWVIQSGHHAIWVTGHRPAGRGFSLKPELSADTYKWLEVVGRLETQAGVPSLRATSVALSAPAASVLLGPRLRTPAKPEVVFTLPLAGPDPVAADAVFLVQFSTYMDGESFEDRVRLRYGDQPAPSDVIGSARWRYDEAKRTLVVDPGAPLRAGASVELLLLPGIADAWLTPLPAAPGRESDPALLVLRWQVEG